MTAERFETDLAALVNELGELTKAESADIPKLLQSIASIPAVEACLRGNVTAQEWLKALEQLQKEARKSATLRKKMNAALEPYGVEAKQALDRMLKVLSYCDHMTFFTNKLIEENRTWIGRNPEQSLEIAARVTDRHLDDIFRIFTVNVFPIQLTKANAKALHTAQSSSDVEACLASIKTNPKIISTLKDAYKHYVIRALKSLPEASSEEKLEKPASNQDLGAVDLTALLARLMDVTENFETKSPHEVAASLAIITGLGLDKVLAVKDAQVSSDHEVSLAFEGDTAQTAKVALPAEAVTSLFKYYFSLNANPVTVLKNASKAMEILTRRTDINHKNTAPLHATILESIASSDLLQQAGKRLDDYKTAIQQKIVHKAVDIQDDIDLQRKATHLAMIIKRIKNFHVNVKSIRETLKCSQDHAMQLAKLARDAISAQGEL